VNPSFIPVLDVVTKLSRKLKVRSGLG